MKIILFVPAKTLFKVYLFHANTTISVLK